MFIGAFFLINLLLAVINSTFNTINGQEKEKIRKEKEKRRLKLSKQKSSTDDFEFDETEFMDEFGIDQYWVGKRVAKRFMEQLRKREARIMAEEIERRNRPPEEDDDEPKIMAPTLPDAWIPPEEKNMVDQPDSGEDDEDFDLQI